MRAKVLLVRMAVDSPLIPALFMASAMGATLVLPSGKLVLM